MMSPQPIKYRGIRRRKQARFQRCHPPPLERRPRNIGSVSRFRDEKEHVDRAGGRLCTDRVKSSADANRQPHLFEAFPNSG